MSNPILDKASYVERIHQALGYACRCWDDKGVFRTSDALSVATELCEDFKNIEVERDTLKAEKETIKTLKLKIANEYADYKRIIRWMKDPKRKPANLAFTEGAERQIAYAFEGLFGMTQFCIQCEIYAKELEAARKDADMLATALEEEHAEAMGYRVNNPGTCGARDPYCSICKLLIAHEALRGKP